jgi:predicted lipase
LVDHLIAARLINHSYYKNSLFDWQDINDTRYICIPGTKKINDWSTNLLITPYQEEGYQGKVRLHKGFYLNYQQIREQIFKIAATDLDLAIAGHSKGGCIAQIAGVDLNFNLNKEIKVITFGSPACGNKHWQESAQKRIASTNYFNLLDVVPWLLPYYFSVGKSIYNSKLYSNPHCIRNYIDAFCSKN